VEEGFPARTARAQGFTLVELLIVVVILAIFSVIALPSATKQRAEAVKSALKANVQNVAMQIEYQKQGSLDGKFPPALLASWFTGDNLPAHPDAMAGVPQIETVATPGLVHPRNKLVTPGATGAYWYNSATGAVRARVKSLGNSVATLACYNEVNGCHAATMVATTESAPAVVAVAPR
jgi:prepilin-type N-terminal cleavage/methylation domain-containing protein